MKIQELLEAQQQTRQFNNYDEYVKFMESNANDSTAFYFEQIPAEDGEEYEIVAEVHSFHSTPGGRSPAYAETPDEVTGDTEIDWTVQMYGTGDYNTDTNFWVKMGEVALTQKAEEWVEDQLVQKMEDAEPDYDGPDDY